jgi:hypothetical protein
LLLVEKGTLDGLMYCKMEGARALMRREARIAELAMKRAIANSKSLEKREEARVEVMEEGLRLD